MPDAPLKIRLDPCNPGQFFACCGLFELLSREEPGLLSYFDSTPNLPRNVFFSIQTGRGPGILKKTLEHLRRALVTFPDERPEPPVRPVAIDYGGEVAFELDWWLDEFREKTTNLKCWAGQVTTARLFRELLPLIDSESNGEGLFGRAASTNSLFGVDPRSAWKTLDLGFSPNEHGVASTVFPAVEILAAIGLQYFRPDAANRLAIHYSLWADPLPASVARLAFSVPWDGLACADFVFKIRKRGQSYKYFSFAEACEKESENHES